MLLLAALVPSVSSAATKRIYIANDDHTDYMWTGDDVQYRGAFLAMLDYYMNQSEATASNPSDSRGRFNMDGSVWLWEFERHRSQAQYDRLISHLRAGNLSMPLNMAVLCYGGMSAEAVLRSMYYAGRIERRENLRFPLVAAMENQTLPAGLASLWAGAGAKYSWRGVCGCATRTPWGNRPREIYHFAGPDGQSVCMKWNTLYGSSPGTIGGYAEAQDPVAAVNYLHGNATFLSKWPWDPSAAFGHGGDALQTTTGAFVSTSQSMSNASRRVIVSNQIDFFEDFLSSHSDDIPSFAGSFGNEWDLYIASMGEVTADFRRTLERLRTAEALATVAAIHDPSFMTGRTAARDSAFLAAGMYYEHDWTGDGPIARSRRAQWQRQLLAALHRYVDPLHADGLAAVGARVAQPGAGERHVVFNPLSWPRDAAVDLPSPMAPPLHVVEVASGQAVPCQVMGSGASQVVRILARGVPSVGYKTYEVRAGAGPSFPPAATVSGATLDNGVYAVTLGGSGNLTSILDRKDGNRQLVDVASGSVHSLGNGSGAVSVESSGPVSTTLRVVSGGSPAHETRVTLHAGLDRIDIEGLVTQNFSSSVAYSSRFNLAGCTIRHEEVGMIAKVARAAQGGDYADQNTRTDWLSFGHFVDLSTATRGVTVSNWDSPFFQSGNSTTSTLDGSTPWIKACVGMQVDGAAYGIPNQGGDTRFLNRYALRTHGAYDAGAAMRFALEHQNPLVATRVTGSSASPLPADSWSMLALPSSDVLLWALKPAEEGIDQGVIARVWNVADGARSMSLSLPGIGIDHATRATHIETDLEPAAVSGGVVAASLARQEMRTFRLFVGGATPANRVPLAVASGAPLSGPAPLAVQFTSSGSSDADGDPLTFHWAFGDGQSGNGASVSHTYGNPGSYSALLTVDDGRGGVATATVAVTVSGLPPGFPSTPVLDGFNRANGTIGTSWAGQTTGFVIANNALVPASSSYATVTWNDAAFGPDQEAFVTLGAITATAPEHDVLLKVQGTGSGTAQIEVRYDASVNRISVSTYTPTTGWTTWSTLAVTLAAGDQFGASARANGDVMVYRNGIRLTTVSVAGWTYATQGGRIGLKAGNAAASRFDDFGGGNVVTPPPNRVPVAVASGTPLSGPAPLTVQFSGAGSSDADGDPLACGWSFGDGQSASGTSLSHTYTSAGNFLAVLTVTDGRGGSALDTVAVHVTDGVLGTGPSGDTLAFHGAVPNPAPRDGLFVSFTLPDAAAARIEVLDIAGRRLTHRDIGALGAGRHRVELARQAGLAPGVYLIRLIRGSTILSRRAVLVR